MTGLYHPSGKVSLRAEGNTMSFAHACLGEALVASRFSVGGEVETSEFEFRKSAPKMRKTNGTHAWAHTHTQQTTK